MSLATPRSWRRQTIVYGGLSPGPRAPRAEGAGYRRAGESDFLAASIILRTKAAAIRLATIVRPFHRPASMSRMLTPRGTAIAARTREVRSGRAARGSNLCFGSRRSAIEPQPTPIPVRLNFCSAKPISTYGEWRCRRMNARARYLCVICASFTLSGQKVAKTSACRHTLFVLRDNAQLVAQHGSDRALIGRGEDEWVNQR